jgi:hypothetical protein
MTCFVSIRGICTAVRPPPHQVSELPTNCNKTNYVKLPQRCIFVCCLFWADSWYSHFNSHVLFLQNWNLTNPFYFTDCNISFYCRWRRIFWSFKTDVTSMSRIFSEKLKLTQLVKTSPYLTNLRVSSLCSRWPAAYLVLSRFQTNRPKPGDLCNTS